MRNLRGMYEAYFHLKCRPFDLAPDPRFMYLTAQHSRAVANVRFALINHDSFVIITGEIGTGKTTVLNTALAELGPKFVAARLVHTTLSDVELLQALLSEFGIPNYGTKRVKLLDALRAHFLEQHAAGRHVVIIVDEARELEPAVASAAALLSPATGIIDVHELMHALLSDVEAHGGVLVRNTSVQRVRPVAQGLELTIRNGDDESTVVARRVVNSAGLGAIDLTHRIEGYPNQLIPAAYFAKGNYFSCTARPFRHLVYPMPDEAGLGIHATVDLDDSVRFGPDVEWVDAVNYRVDTRRAQDFYASIREYWPALPDNALQPAFAGMRPKIVGPGQQAADFVIAGPGQHGIRGLVNLLGIESPGLTAALAMGDYVRTQLGP